MYDDYQRLLTKVATLYYVDDIPQNVIAMQLHLSKSKVCRLLAEAKKQGIVHTSIYSTHEQSSNERLFERHYGLREAIIVSGSGNPLDGVGSAGAEYLRRVIREGDIIGVSWGRTLYSIVSKINTIRVDNVQIVQLVGGLDTMMNQVQSGKLAMQFAIASGCDAQLLYCPARAGSMELKQSLMIDPVVNQVFQSGRKANIALVGIGAVSPTSDLFQSGHLQVDMLRELREAGAVGDICMRFYDESGREVKARNEDLTMSIAYEDLRRIPNVVAVATGMEKGDAILGALKSGILNTLIIDKTTAEYVLSLDGLTPEH